MAIAKHLIRDGNIATCYMFKEVFPPKSGKEQDISDRCTWWNIAFSEGLSHGYTSLPRAMLDFFLSNKKVHEKNK